MFLFFFFFFPFYSYEMEKNIIQCFIFNNERIQFGSTIRFVRPKPSKFWGIKVIPSQYGVNFRFRNKKPDIAQKLGAQINDKR